MFSAIYPVKDLTDKSKWDPWIQEQLKKVQTAFADGINIDIEDPVENGSDEASLLTQLVAQTYKTFKDANTNYKVSVLQCTCTVCMYMYVENMCAHACTCD